ncbi:HPr Serine kinase C-terminal domain-containing protein [Thalassospira xiamenensis M-5 = DSM 17429]|uniref:Serine kinase/phosphorylase n=1 Tax=Thalassospira xiamenensis M-5 = DSM 17429 TaxID=1123366 RepID=A0AB72U7H8_9PROT|nr:HPr kinase/phosphatase C-terminal domain-containing protein [Thalassospira xiamenensis]AJD50193.1 putative serine kinase/phosphorylase [Thalassospira xiamenensis M-5 = DSM 17429]SIT27528.1 HPr Serine kinase C-terminal domain-containing protein [Thalassospira xiamenensis M-5 = DSM 17429]
MHVSDLTRPDDPRIVLPDMTQIHANCVALGPHAILLRGPSGSGKSNLALRLVRAGGRLVSDDRTDLVAHEGKLIASAPIQIARLCEVRGIGIVRGLAHQAAGDVRVLFDLVADPAGVERMPEPRSETFCGISIPSWKIWPFDMAVDAKIEVALSLATGEMQLET